jgi:hypothetical protein
MLKLTNNELAILGWLCDNGGKGTFSEKTRLDSYYRLVRAGYVEIQFDRNLDAIHFTLTEFGREAQEAWERQKARGERHQHQKSIGEPRTTTSEAIRILLGLNGKARVWSWLQRRSRLRRAKNYLRHYPRDLPAVRTILRALESQRLEDAREVAEIANGRQLSEAEWVSQAPRWERAWDAIVLPKKIVNR